MAAPTEGCTRSYTPGARSLRSSDCRRSYTRRVTAARSAGAIVWADRGGDSSTMKASSVSVKSLTTSRRRRLLPVMPLRLLATASRMSRTMRQPKIGSRRP